MDILMVLFTGAITCFVLAIVCPVVAVILWVVMRRVDGKRGIPTFRQLIKFLRSL